VVGFGGAGVAAGRGWLGGERETVVAGGAGLRYLVAKSYGMHTGIDVARGPDQTIWYVVFGNGWFRPRTRCRLFGEYALQECPPSQRSNDGSGASCAGLAGLGRLQADTPSFDSVSGLRITDFCRAGGAP
jgi:hypothetical protein